MECVVLDWLYGTISHDLLQEVMSPTASARTVWRDLEFQFLGNRELRAVNLSAEFHTFQQGDLSVTEYCRRLRTMADSLADLGEPQSDRTLVLTLINGLSPNMQSLLPMQVPFPSFLQARSQLLLEEITKGHRPASEPATAFVASTAGARTAQNIPNNQGGGGGGGSSGNNSRNRRRGRGNGGGNSGQGSGHGGQTAGSQGGQGTGGQLAGHARPSSGPLLSTHGLALYICGLGRPQAYWAGLLLLGQFFLGCRHLPHTVLGWANSASLVLSHRMRVCRPSSDTSQNDSKIYPLKLCLE